MDFFVFLSFMSFLFYFIEFFYVFDFIVTVKVFLFGSSWLVWAGDSRFCFGVSGAGGLY